MAFRRLIFHFLLSRCRRYQITNCVLIIAGFSLPPSAVSPAWQLSAASVGGGEIFVASRLACKSLYSTSNKQRRLFCLRLRCRSPDDNSATIELRAECIRWLTLVANLRSAIIGSTLANLISESSQSTDELDAVIGFEWDGICGILSC